MSRREEWRSVEWCPRYEVSDAGRLRRIKPDGTARALFPGPDARGYVYATLSLGDGSIRRCTMHGLVAVAFIGPRPPGHTVNHRNGEKGDNRPENLEWATPAENIRHSIEFGLKPDISGERNKRHKLSDERALLVYQLAGLSEWSQEEIGRAVGVGQTTVSRIHCGQRRCLGPSGLREVA